MVPAPPTRRARRESPGQTRSAARRETREEALGETRARRPGETRQADLPSAGLIRARDGVFELPSGLRGARMAPPWLAVAGAAIVVVLAVAAVAFSFMRGGPSSEPVATSVRSASPSNSPTAGAPRADAVSGAPPAVAALPGASPTAPMAPTTGGAAGSSAELMVHVIGEVRRAGVVTVPAGARVTDAIAKAGGPTRAAVLTGLNLARPLVDGEQVVVPDAKGGPVPINTMPPPASSSGAGPAASPGQAAGPAGLVDLNTADEAALDSLPGVGPVLAGRILEWRTAHGRFSTVDELGEVEGVGEKKLESLRARVRV